MCNAMDIPSLDYTDFIKHTLSASPYCEESFSQRIQQKISDNTATQEWVTDQYLMATYFGYTTICQTLLTFSTEAYHPLPVVQEVVAESKKDKKFINEKLRGTSFSLDIIIAALNDHILKGTLTQEWINAKYVAAVYLGYTTVCEAFENLKHSEHLIHHAIKDIVDIKQKEKALRTEFNALAELIAPRL